MASIIAFTSLVAALLLSLSFGLLLEWLLLREIFRALAASSRVLGDSTPRRGSQRPGCIQELPGFQRTGSMA